MLSTSSFSLSMASWLTHAVHFGLQPVHGLVALKAESGDLPEVPVHFVPVPSHFPAQVAQSVGLQLFAPESASHSHDSA